MNRNETNRSHFNAIQKGNYTEGVTASELATFLQLDRANVSSDLNKLVKDKRLLKQIRDLFVLHRNEHFVGNAFKRHNFIRYICN